MKQDRSIPVRLMYPLPSLEAAWPVSWECFRNGAGGVRRCGPTHSKPAQPVLAELGSDYSCVLCYPELLPDAFKMEI